MITLVLLFITSPALALDLTPLYGGQGGGHLGHINTGSTLTMDSTPVSGVIVSWPMSHFQEYEVYFSQQHTRLLEGDIAVPQQDLISLDVRTLHWGGTVLSEERGNGLRGFLSGGLGVTQYTPSLGVAAAEMRPSASLGLGARWMPTERVGVRLEGRLFGTLFNSNTTIFCSGGCSFTISGDLLTQYALFAGLVVRLD